MWWQSPACLPDWLGADRVLSGDGSLVLVACKMVVEGRVAAVTLVLYLLEQVGGVDPDIGSWWTLLAALVEGRARSFKRSLGRGGMVHGRDHWQHHFGVQMVLDTGHLSLLKTWRYILKWMRTMTIKIPKTITRKNIILIL